MGGTKTQKAKGIPDNADIFTQASDLSRCIVGRSPILSVILL